MARQVLYHVIGADVDIGSTTLLNGYKELRTSFSKIYGVQANPKAGINAPDVPINVDWITRSGSQWIIFRCGDFDCEVIYTITGRD